MGAELPIQAGVMLVMLGGAALFHGFTREFELYKGEKKLTRNLGLSALVLFILMIAVRIALPYGDWSTSTFDYNRDYDGTLKQYTLLEQAPVVRDVDLGMPLKDGKNNYLDISREYTPVGERWLVENTYWDTKMTKLGCETVAAPTRGQARLALRQMLAEIRWWSDSLNREKVSSYLVLAAPPQVEMEEVKLDWAEEAWYGENDSASVLVVRVGKQVTRVSAPMRLNEGDWLAVIEDRLTG